jgi:hypothetical protein
MRLLLLDQSRLARSYDLIYGRSAKSGKDALGDSPELSPSDGLRARAWSVALRDLPPKTFLRSVFAVGVLEGPDAATR